MPLATEQTRARKSARLKHGPKLLAALLRGASIDEIAATHRLTAKRVHNAVRDELQRRWTPPADDYARLQIARLDLMAAKLLQKTEDGDLRAVDRLLRLADRLDRYHGFSKATPAIAEDYAAIHERLMAKMNSAFARADAPSPELEEP